MEEFFKIAAEVISLPYFELLLLKKLTLHIHMQRHGGWTWGGGNLSSMSASVSTLGDSGWLIHVQSVLAGSAWIAARVALEKATVLVHCRYEVIDF